MKPGFIIASTCLFFFRFCVILFYFFLDFFFKIRKTVYNLLGSGIGFRTVSTVVQNLFLNRFKQRFYFFFFSLRTHRPCGIFLVTTPRGRGPLFRVAYLRVRGKALLSRPPSSVLSLRSSVITVASAIPPPGPSAVYLLVSMNKFGIG